MMRNRRGFTLVELMVAMAVFLVVIAMALGSLSNYFAARTAYAQEMILQQDFRNAMDRMRFDFAQASSKVSITSPGSNTVSHTLTFSGADGTTITYALHSNGQTSYITRNGEMVTEDMHQIVDLYFLRSGGKIVVIVVGHMKYFGTDRAISFSSMIVSRNANYAK